MSYMEEHGATIGLVLAAILGLLVVGFIYSIDKLNDEAANHQINQSREFVNKTIVSNSSAVDKILVSKAACDMYYTYSDKNVCYEQVIKEHV